MDIDAIITEAISKEYTTVYPVTNFTIDELDKLSKKAKENNVNIRIATEWSNFYQGTLVEVQRNWDTVEERLDKEKSTFEIRVFDHKKDKVAYKRLTKSEAINLNKLVKLEWQ